MSTTPSRPRTFSTLLEIIARLQSQFSSQDFYECLMSVIEDVLGVRSATLVGLVGDEWMVLHSTRLGSLRSRLRAPLVDADQLLELAGAAPQDRVGLVISDESISIDDTAHPVVNVWRLGEGGASVGFILFHEEGSVDNPELVADIAPELRRIASVAFFKLVDREQLQEQLALYQAKLHSINEVGELFGSLDIDVLLPKLMELSLYIVSGESGSVVLTQEGDEEERCQVEWGFSLDMARQFVDREGRVVYERVMETAEPLLIREFDEASEFKLLDDRWRVSAYLCVPLISKGRCLGVVNLLNSDGGKFSDLDLEIITTMSGLAATAIDNAVLYADSMEKERYQQSLEIARDIQTRLYPAEAPKINGLDIAWQSQSADETGGDYFDFVPQDEDSLIVAVGDVSGHGIGAALLMASARAGLRAIIGQEEDTAKIFERLNDQLERDTEVERFMTLFTCRIDRKEGVFSFVNAGHDAPCVYRAATGEVEELGSTGLPLGMFPGMSYNQKSVEGLNSGDIVMFTTDGVWEVNSPDGTMLGKPDLIEILQRHAALPAEEITRAVLADVAEFTAGAPPNDDVTIVVIRCE